MPGVHAFEAGSVAPGVRLRAWGDVTSRLLLPLQMWARTGTIAGRIYEEAAGPVAVSRYAASPHFGLRSEASIVARPAEGMMKVAVVLRGSVTVRQGAEPVTLHVGESAAYATWLPYAVGSDTPFDVLIAMLPMEYAGLERDDLERDSALRIPRTHTAALRSSMLNAGAFNQADAHMFGDKVSHALQLSAASITEDRKDADHVFRAAVRLMHRRATSPWISPAYIADVLGVSRRTLYSAFSTQSEGSVARTLRSIRLDRARDALAENPETPIREIARQAGYDDPAHFTRAFRREFGRTPSVDRDPGHFVQPGDHEGGS